MRTEEDIRERLDQLDLDQQKFNWTDAERAVHAKIAIRAQMKGLKFALGEEKGFSIMEG